jgi:hypothetical protein
MFDRVPSLLDNDHDQWTLSAHDTGLLRDIIIDVHFLDFTPLNDVPPDNHTME